jgi:hypothetical protein
MKSHQLRGHLYLLVIVVMLDGTACAIAGDAVPQSDRARGFRPNIEPFFRQHCLDCHDGAEPDGDFSLTELGYDPSISGDAAAQWQKVSQKLILGEMPPKDEPRPKQDELDAVIERVNSELQRSARILRSKGGNEVVFRRLNKRQFNGTVHDMFGLEGDRDGGAAAHAHFFIHVERRQSRIPANPPFEARRRWRNRHALRLS